MCPCLPKHTHRETESHKQRDRDREMFDVWSSAVGWWDEWQLRILVLGSLGIQWFLLVAAPMRKYGQYTIRRYFMLCIRLAYISSDALAIYALATLFNRHVRATSGSSSCDGIVHNKAKILEVLWAPVLLIHLGGQQELTAYTIEDNELWVKHTVTLVSQVAVAMYAFYKSWPNYSDWKLLASAILLFVIGVVSLSEKPWALKKASINRLASVSAPIRGTKKRTRLAVYLGDLLFSDWYNCSTTNSGDKKQAAGEEDDNVGLSDEDKVYMVLSDMSMSAAADDLVQRGRARNVQDVLRPLTLSTKAEKDMKRWLLGAYGLLYTRGNLVFTPTYLVYHVLVVPILHVAALTLFATGDKDGYNRTDVKITYVLLCLTAALDVFAVFIRQLLYRAMSAKGVPSLCETVPGYNLVGAVLRRRHKDIGWLVKCATRMGCKEYFECQGVRQDYGLYKNVSEMVLADLVDAQGRDLANYRVFTVPDESGTAVLPAEDVGAGAEIMQQSSPGAANWALSEELQKVCGPKVRDTLRGSFDRSVLVWHIATDLCFRMEGTPPANYEEDPHWLRIKCTEAISSYMARLLNFHPDMLLTGSRQHLVSEAKDEFDFFLNLAMVGNSGKPLSKDDLTNIIDHGPEGERFRMQVPIGIDNEAEDKEVIRSLFHVPKACSLAKELLKIEPPSTRWRVMYRVWLGMLFYSASMSRGYLHAKSLGEGGEFLSYVWLVLSLKGAKTLVDKLQMVEGDDEEPTLADKPQILEGSETTRNQHPGGNPPVFGLEILRL
ncbi:uncharacterized protein [Triticum aestivum]|nr:uncharacterized protein LOC123064562 [Triticum aestivum]